MHRATTRGRWIVCLLVSLIATSTACSTLAAQDAHDARRVSLDANWRIQSSAKVSASGATIARTSFRATGWYPATLPSTVLAALVANHVYTDPYTGMNLRKIPGTTYKIGTIFSRQEMPEGSPFAVPWWYRTTFRVPAAERGKHLVLHFDGINYRANIWLNGTKIADSSQIAGTFRRFELDISEKVRRQGENVLAVQIFPPGPHDLALTWVDWNPMPPDKDMGLWHDVYLTTSGDVALRHPFVSNHLTSSLDRADLTVMADVQNLTDHAVHARLDGRIGSITFSKNVDLAPHDTTTVRFAPDSFPQLRIANPQLWWPADMGTPTLHQLQLSVQTDNAISDRVTVPFGIREITAEFTPDSALLFRINGRRVLVRGGGWAQDMMLRAQPVRQEAQLLYVRDLHLNTIRLEGKLEDDRFWARTDSLGILVMAGWCCCNGWEEWSKWTKEEPAIAAASQRDQILRLRNHASALVWLNGSDNHPPPDVERTYIDILKRYEWPNPYISSASAKRTEVTGVSGVKMTGPYDWVPPRYWLIDTANGGARGFITETSPGAAVPPIESMRRMLPAKDLWPMDSVWAYHGAGGQFAHSDRFEHALAARYGAPTSAKDFTRKAQLMTYEGERAMFEAYARNKYRSTGVIQWMLSNAWPGTFWHLYDYYLRPGGGYFGSKKALEPVHVQYSYDDRSVVVVNGTATSLTGVHVRARVRNLDATEKFARDTVVDVPADTSLRVFEIPEVAGVSKTYFVDLQVDSASGETVSRNVYWLSTHPDVLDEDSTTWYVTPVKQYADFTALRDLPAAHVTATTVSSRDGKWEKVTVRLSNPGKTIAFFVRLKLTRGVGGDEVLPVLWDDNYVTLMPGETREIAGRVLVKDLRGKRAAVRVEGWNVAWMEAKVAGG